MTKDQLSLLLKAHDSLRAAQLLYQAGTYDFAASRAYYTMFYVAQAFLEGEGLAFSKHSAVIAAFGKHFANTQRVPREFHRYLIDGQEARQEGDYGPAGAVEPDEAATCVRHAQQFLDLAEELIGPIPAEGEQEAGGSEE